MDALVELNTALAGRYTLERVLGRGGMATVYLAVDVKHDRHVALKVLEPEFGAVLGPERFLAEIRTTANLQHPHLLPLFDSGAAVGPLFYVMPFVDGESLRARIERDKQLPVEEAVRIATSVASALEYAHARRMDARTLPRELPALSQPEFSGARAARVPVPIVALRERVVGRAQAPRTKAAPGGPSPRSHARADQWRGANRLTCTRRSARSCRRPPCRSSRSPAAMTVITGSVAASIVRTASSSAMADGASSRERDGLSRRLG
jgi:hypothetical protein